MVRFAVPQDAEAINVLRKEVNGLHVAGRPRHFKDGFGPELRDIHTPRETMDIASVERTWKLMLKVLEELV